ncbi:MAG: tripartite tricarboxylate transporter substrate binding protein [Betaproteobacteria bacterium]|nr:tripartite tricarboxylate transporter substrate binding protein [Betaproteobacteria bacterium]
MQRFSCAAGVLLLLWGSLAFSQGYPSRPIHVIVPTSPGGVTDILARLVAPRLSESVGQPIVVENRVGASGIIGVEAVSKAAPDGYTLLCAVDSFALNPLLFKKVSYDVLRDFAPITLLARTPLVLVATPKLGVTSLADFVRLAKAKGSALNAATAGPGTPSRLGLDLLSFTVGIDPTLIHYKGGGPAMTDILGAQVDIMMPTLPSAVTYIKAGKLAALAVSSDKRHALAPEIPAVAESFPGFEVQTWVGFLAPAGVRRDIVMRLNEGLIRTLQFPDVRESLAKRGYDAAGTTPEAFGAWMRSEIDKWGRVIRERRITLD